MIFLGSKGCLWPCWTFNMILEVFMGCFVPLIEILVFFKFRVDFGDLTISIDLICVWEVLNESWVFVMVLWLIFALLISGIVIFYHVHEKGWVWILTYLTFGFKKRGKVGSGLGSYRVHKMDLALSRCWVGSDGCVGDNVSCSEKTLGIWTHLILFSNLNFLFWFWEIFSLYWGRSLMLFRDFIVGVRF